MFGCSVILILLSIIWKINGDQSMGYVKLSSGYNMPMVGFGTSRINNQSVMDSALMIALRNGYRHIDTAYVYGNEEVIGNTLKKWFDEGGKREDLFITTKLPSWGMKPELVEFFATQSIKRLQCDYIDLYLVHTPFGYYKDEKIEAPARDDKGRVKLDFDINHREIWKEMEKQVKTGRAKSIGISNFNETQILDLLKFAEIQPSNLQIEVQAYFPQKPLRQFCKNHNISVTGYVPLGSSGRSTARLREPWPPVLKNPTVTRMARKYNKSPAQILLRHSVQGEVIVIPKSTHPERIRDNINIFDFELSEGDMNILNRLDKGREGRAFSYLDYTGVENHPFYPFADFLQVMKEKNLTVADLI